MICDWRLPIFDSVNRKSNVNHHSLITIHKSAITNTYAHLVSKKKM